MSEGTVPEGRSIQDAVMQLVADMNALHKDMLHFREELLTLQTRAGDSGISRLEFAAKDASVKVSKAGEALVAAHLALNLAQSAYGPGEPSAQDEDRGE